MGFLDRIFGTSTPEPQPAQPAPARSASVPASGEAALRAAPGPAGDADEIALERYRYLLRTAPPETIEQVHAEAFAQLTQAQRARLLQELSAAAPSGETPADASPGALARAATRAELRAPGMLEQALAGPGLSGRGGGPSFGAMFGSSLLGSVAGYVIGSALMSAFLAPAFPADAPAADGAQQAGTDQGSGDAASGDAGSGESGSGDAGGYDGGSGYDGGFGDGGFGGDLGGGDFGDFSF